MVLSEYSNPILSFIFRNLNYFHSSSKIIVVPYKDNFFTGTNFEKKKSFGYPMGLFRTFFCNNNMIHAVFHLHLGHFASNFFKPYFRSKHFLCHDLPQCLQINGKNFFDSSVESHIYDCERTITYLTENLDF